MELAGGVIFFLVGLRVVLEQYEPKPMAPAPLPEAPMAAAMRVAFPLVVTPYGNNPSEDAISVRHTRYARLASEVAPVDPSEAVVYWATELVFRES